MEERKMVEKGNKREREKEEGKRKIEYEDRRGTRRVVE